MPEYEQLSESPRTIKRTDPGPAQSWVDLNQWEPGEDVDADELVRDELQAHRREGAVSMMTEIDEGAFVQWGTCGRCSRRVAVCTCADGPTEPSHIARWREERLIKLHPERDQSPEAFAARVAQRAKGSETTQTVDDGLTASLEAVKQASEEDTNDREEASEEASEEVRAQERPQEHVDDPGF